MNIGIFQETNPVGAGNVLVGAIYKNTARSTLLQSVLYVGPYTGQTQTHTFTVSQNIVYYYVCWESPDGSASGTARNAFEIQPGNNTYLVRDDLFLIADTTANFASNTNFYGPDASLIGWNWGLEEVGSGTQQYGVDYVKTVAGVPTTQDDTTADGWELLTPGAVFQSAEKYVIHFLPQLITNAGSTNTLITTTSILTGNTVLDNTAINQAFLLQGAAGYFQVTLPDVSTVPDDEPIYFISAGGSHINVGIFGASGQLIEWYLNQANLSGGTRVNRIYLGQCEKLTVYVHTYPDSSKKWIVLNGGDAYKAVGEQISTYSKQPLNTIMFDGGLYSQTIYARAWEWISTLESGILISDSLHNATITGGANAQTYNSNYGRFTNAGTTFRVPQIYAYGFQRFVQGTGGRFPGSLEIVTTESHDHTMDGTSFNGTGGPYWLARNLNGAYSGGGSDQIGRKTGGPDRTLRTGNDNSGVAGNQFETKPTNFGIYALMRI